MSEDKPKLLEQVYNCMRLQRMSPRTISVYLDWIKRYIRHFRQPDGTYRHPAEMGVVEIGQFLTHLVGGRHAVAASTQKQALCALVYLYGHVLKINLGDISFLRSKRTPIASYRCRNW